VVLGPQEDVRSCAVSPDGRWVATGNHTNTQGVGAKVWDASTGRLVKDLPMKSGSGVGFSPDGQWLMSTGGGCRLWAVGTWEPGPVIGKESNFAFSPDGRMMAVAGEDHGIRLVETATGREYVRLDTTEQTRFLPQTFTPDGASLIALGSESRALHVWDLRRIRKGLVELGLDWDAPLFPKALDLGKGPPLEVTVDHIDIHVNTATVVHNLRVKGDHAGAIAVIQKAQIALPEDPELNNTMAWMLVTATDPKVRDAKRAVALAQKAIKGWPNRWEPWRTLGLAYHFDANNQKAVEALKKSLELHRSGDASDYFPLAAAHQQLGNKDEAREWYDRGVAWARANKPLFPSEIAMLRADAETALGIGKQPEPDPIMPPAE
jgi:Flp pilus assembly protein TadD